MDSPSTHQGPDVAATAASGPRSAVTTDIYRTGAAPYARAVMWRLAARRWWLIALPFIAALVAAVADVRWLFVALCWLLLIAPVIVFNAYISALVTPEARRAMQPQQLSVTPGGDLVITYFSRPDNSPREPQHDRLEPCGEDYNAELEHCGEEHIPAADVVSVDRSGPYVRFTLRHGPLRLLLVPADAMEQAYNARWQSTAATGSMAQR